MTARDDRARDEQEGCTCSMGSSCPYCKRVMRARDERQAADELTAHDQEQGHYGPSPRCDLGGRPHVPHMITMPPNEDWTHCLGVPYEQPAPPARETAADERKWEGGWRSDWRAPRETAADELAEAEEYQLTYALEIADRAASSLPMKTLAGAVRKRGRERDAARAEVEQLRAAAFSIGADPDYDPRAELEQLRTVNADILRATAKDRARIGELERRDTAAEAVDRVWDEKGFLAPGTKLRAALDEQHRVRREGEQ